MASEHEQEIRRLIFLIVSEREPEKRKVLASELEPAEARRKNPKPCGFFSPQSLYVSIAMYRCKLAFYANSATLSVMLSLHPGRALCLVS